MEQLFGTIPTALSVLVPNAEVDEAVVFAAWKRCAGAMLAERAVPCEFFENRLVVAVEDELWRRHLEELAPQMIARINGYLTKGPVRFIEFRVDPRCFKARRRPNGAAAGKASPDVPRSIAEAAENIADPSLRISFLEAAAAYLARQEADS